MGFFKRLLCCCCLPRKKSRRARKEHPQQTGLYEMSETLPYDEKMGSAQPFTSQYWLVTSDLEMPAAQLQNDANSDLQMPAAQIQNYANSDLEMPAAQIQNYANSDLEMPTAQIQNDANSDLDMPTAQIQNYANSDLEMPMAQIQNYANSDLGMPTVQIQNDANSDLDMPTAQIQNYANSDLEMPMALIQNYANSDLEMPTAQIQNDANSDLDMPTAQIQNNANSDLEMPMAQIQNYANSDLEMPTVQIQNDANSDLDMPTAQIQNYANSDLEMPMDQIQNYANSDLEMPTVQIQNDANSDLEIPTAQIQNDANSDLDMPTAQIQNYANSDLEMPMAQIQNYANSDIEMPTAQIQNDANSDLEMPSRTELTPYNLDEEDRQSQLQLETIGGNSEFSQDEEAENAEQKVSECGSEQEEQAAVGQSELKIETTAPHCEVREKTGPGISEESFVFHKVLGRGGFGKVMLAELKASGGFYAVKTQAKARFLNNEVVNFLRTENRVLMSATESPFFSRLHCTFQTKDYLFLVMEYISGGDLSFHLDQRGNFDLASVRFFAAEIICGLQFLHRNGIIYRDLKPENVMLDQDGHIKIIDFGLSKDNMFGDSRTKTFCGTAQYMAPEIYQGQEYSTPVDWWALGVLLFELRTGNAPFNGKCLDDLSKSACSDTPDYPFWVNSCTRDLLGKLLRRDPDRRLGTSGNIRAHPFFKCINWARIERREVKPPYKPILNSPLDCSNFEEDFLNETPGLSQGGSGHEPIDQSEFVGFSFMNPDFAADMRSGRHQAGDNKTGTRANKKLGPKGCKNQTKGKLHGARKRK